MGDRANVAVQSDGKRVYLYTHWAGSELPETVRAGLKRGEGRWSDPPYLARIIFCEMVRDNPMSETGYGISTEPGDNEKPILVVDCDKKRVTIEADEREGFSYRHCKPAGKILPWSFAEYTALKRADWVTLDTGLTTG